MIIDSDRSECEACSWQGPSREVDSGFCPECGGECFEIDGEFDEESEDE